jgi:hypothetical protein
VRTRSLRPGRDLRLLAGDATAFCAGDAAAPTRSWPRAKASGLVMLVVLRGNSSTRHGVNDIDRGKSRLLAARDHDKAAPPCPCLPCFLQHERVAASAPTHRRSSDGLISDNFSDASARSTAGVDV